MSNTAIIKIDIKDKSTPMIRRLESLMVGKNEIHKAIAGEEYLLFRNHLEQAEPTRHNTAQRLGAAPTGHLQRAADSVESSHDASNATISITSPGIRRAFGPVEIRPVRRRALTIPSHAASYGKRVSDLANDGWKIFRLKGMDVLAGRREGDENPTVLFWLRAKTVLQHDPGLLPSNDQIADAAMAAIEKLLRRKIKKS